MKLRMRVYVYSILVVLYIISKFLPSFFLTFSIGIVSIIALALSLFYAKGLYLITGVCFFIIGTGLFIYNDLPWYTFLLHFEPMLGLLSLFLVLPFINSLIRVGHYDKNLSLLLQQGVSNLSQLYRRSFIVCHFLGLFLNIATLPLLVNSLHVTLSKLPKHTADKFYTQNLLRAYALCLTWSPMEVMVSTSIDLTAVKYYEIFLILISLAVITLLFDWTLSSYKYKKIYISIENKTDICFKKVYRKIIEMLGMLVVFILLVSWIQHILNKGFLFSVVLLLIPISIIWATLIGKTKRYFALTLPYWKIRTTGLANYFFMFLSAGLFVEMLDYSGVLSILQSLLISESEKILLLYLTIGGYFLFTSLIGFHPFVSITLLAELLQPILSGVNPISLTIVLISCSLATVMYSPYNVSVSILSDQLAVNPYRLGAWNIGFAIMYMLISIFMAYLLGVIF
jgi:hypothetical protein